MEARYGPQHWWPGDTPFEVMVGAVLTQAVAWTNVEKAIANLKSAGALSPEALRRVSHDELASLLRPAGYYNAKSRKLKALVRYLGDRFDDDIAIMSAAAPGPLRAELLGVYGIGEETADSILLYALGIAVFVVDAYTRRIFARLGLAPAKDGYDEYQQSIARNLSPDAALYGEYHGLIVRHGKEVCRPRPLCEGCCLLELCPTGRANVAGRP